MKINGLVLLVLFALFAGAQAKAEQAATCYKLYKLDGPESMSTFARNIEIWCYQELVYPAGSVYVYNIDHNEVRPELAMVVEPDGIVTHGSLLDGDVTIHRVHRNEFNPYAVPLKEPRHLTPIHIDMNSYAVSAQKVLQTLSELPADHHTIAIAAEDTMVSEQATAAKLPWRGYWWSYKGGLLWSGSNAPLVKYDKFVQARTGSSPGAASWERANHAYRGVWWEGHCNGWAAASVLRREPTASKSDPRSGVTFGVSDQKGLYTVVDYCTKAAFFGKRYRGSGDSRDIYPALFHKTLKYYIGQLRKPVIFDYRSDTTVDNHVISGYNMTVRSTGTNTYDVTTVLTVHKYDGSRSEKPGVAPRYTRTYRYGLVTDSRGNPTGGSWKSANPDFLWVPLSPAECSSNNARVDSSRVGQIMAL